MLRTGPAPGEVHSALIYSKQNLARNDSKSHFSCISFTYLDFQLLRSFSYSAQLLKYFPCTIFTLSKNIQPVPTKYVSQILPLV